MRVQGIVFAASVLLTGNALAQFFTDNNQTNTINGVSTNFLPNAYYVGRSWDYDALVIQNGGVLINAYGSIGEFAGANSNTVLVTGSGSVWTNAFVTNDVNFNVGNYGAGNSLTISNGGQLDDYWGSIGNQSGANGNTVLVTGGGSAWKNTTSLYVGGFGASNSLAIATGGYVSNRFGYIGYAGDHNALTVTGSGAQWSGANNLYVGYSGRGNSLTITNGGYVGLVGQSYLGYFESSNNAVVTGSGSVWSNSGIYIGYIGSANSLTITNGGTVQVNGSSIGDQEQATGNTVLVTGSGSALNSELELLVGEFGASNALTIANGGKVISSFGYIGDQTNANGNAVLVTGSGSLWQGTGNLYVGNSGAGNSLTISNGGYVYFDSGASIGASSGSSNNTVTVGVGGSLVITNYTHNNTLWVGQAGDPGNTLRLNGGTVMVDQLNVLYGPGSSVAFNSGVLSSGDTIVIDPQDNFNVGDGIDAAVFHLAGGAHTFVYNALVIQSNAMLTGCGDVDGILVVNAGGKVLADCGGTLTIALGAANYGTIVATNGTVIDFSAPMYNLGLINLVNGSANFSGGLSGTGVVLTKKDVQISSIQRSGSNLVIQMQSSASNAMYQLQFSPSLHPANWTNVGPSQSGGAALTFTDSGAAANHPARFYRVDITSP